MASPTKSLKPTLEKNLPDVVQEAERLLKNGSHQKDGTMVRLDGKFVKVTGNTYPVIFGKVRNYLANPRPLSGSVL